jgi:hypothetical protein
LYSCSNVRNGFHFAMFSFCFFFMHAHRPGDFPQYINLLDFQFNVFWMHFFLVIDDGLGDDDYVHTLCSFFFLSFNGR